MSGCMYGQPDGNRFFHVISGMQIRSFDVRDDRTFREISMTIFESSHQILIVSMNALGLRQGHDGQEIGLLGPKSPR